MIEILITLLIISISANLFARYIDPLQWIKQKMGLSTQRLLRSKIKVIDILIYTIWKLLNCVGCIAYWTTVIWFYYNGTFDGFYLGVISYAMAVYIENNILITRL